MKGLEQYISKHGKHFTEQLALAVTDGRWDGVKVEKAAQRKVYYNVTGSTLGDMVYLTNWADMEYSLASKNHKATIDRCLRYTIYIIGNYAFHEGLPFQEWLEDLADFDFTPYI